MEENRPKSKWPWILVVLIILIGLGYFFWTKNKAPEVLPGSNGTSANSETTNPRPSTIPEGVQGEFGDEALTTTAPPAPLPPKIITLSGKYVYSEDIKSQTVGKVCFIPDPSTVGVGKQFCFDNGDEVFAIFGLQKGFSDGAKQCTISAKAKIEIKDYTKLTADVGGYDSATLTKVISLGTPAFSPCQK